METADALALSNAAIRLGVLQPHHAEEAWEEMGQRGGDVGKFLRVMERKGYLTPWQSGKLLKNESDGYFLGGFRILYKIASGTFGRVYRADDPRSGRIVAVKVLRRKWSENKHVIDLFEREGRMGMSLHHPNIVEIIAVNQDPVSKAYFIVMEFIEGDNLRKLLNGRKKFEPIDAIRILDDATAGLAFAYSRGITHRDMKLTNVLVSSAGVAKLVDFGLAEITNMFKNQWDVTGEVQVDRTVDYAGLEKMTGVAHGDTRSDIFFLGCVMYEMLTGRSPMDMTKDKTARMQRERFLNIPPMSPEDVKGPPSLFRLIETMMNLDLGIRYQTPSQLLDAVREVRRELEGKGGGGQKAGTKTLFLVEKDERLQDVLRDKLKELGFRVLIAGDPQRALDRFRQTPFEVLIVDGGTTGEQGILVYDKILADALRRRLPCAGILLLNHDQIDWQKRLQPHPKSNVLVQPIKLKQLIRTVQELQ